MTGCVSQRILGGKKAVTKFSFKQTSESLECAPAQKTLVIITRFHYDITHVDWSFPKAKSQGWRLTLLDGSTQKDCLSTFTVG